MMDVIVEEERELTELAGSFEGIPEAKESKEDNKIVDITYHQSEGTTLLTGDAR